MLLLFNLRGEESNSSRHFIDATNFTNERALEGVHIRVQLCRWGITVSCRTLRDLRDTHVFELYIPEFTKLVNCVMGDFLGHEELHQAHWVGAYVCQPSRWLVSYLM